jgi:hypothetical protein
MKIDPWGLNSKTSKNLSWVMGTLRNLNFKILYAGQYAGHKVDPNEAGS